MIAPISRASSMRAKESFSSEENTISGKEKKHMATSNSKSLSRRSDIITPKRVPCLKMQDIDVSKSSSNSKSKKKQIQIDDVEDMAQSSENRDRVPSLREA
jgi:cytochrome oxidase assembly protein ShyY1